MQRTITSTVACDCCIPGGCISGSRSEYRTTEGKSPSGCNDYLTAYTQAATKTGMYRCTGSADDSANIVWSGGSKKITAGTSQGPCYGTVSFDFNAYIPKGTQVSCTAESWGGGISCSISCCYISAP